MTSKALQVNFVIHKDDNNRRRRCREMPFLSEYPSHVQRTLKMHCTGRITYFPDLLRKESRRGVRAKNILGGQRLIYPKSISCRVARGTVKF